MTGIWLGHALTGLGRIRNAVWEISGLPSLQEAYRLRCQAMYMKLKEKNLEDLVENNATPHGSGTQLCRP